MTVLKPRLGATRPRKSARHLLRKAVAKATKPPRKVAPKAMKAKASRKPALRKATPKTPTKVKAKRVVVRKVGGSLIADVVKDMGLTVGQTLAVAYDGARLILVPKAAEPKRYTLRQILASCNFDLPKTGEELEWEAAPRVGREAL
jgi:antitoxin component of MazEF toxin-antitoxin module